MKLGIYGRKVGMTQIFDENGAIVPVTVVDASNCQITQVKTKENDGYSALQVAYGERKPQGLNKCQAGHLKKAGVPARAKISEIRFDLTDDLSQLKAGQQLSPAMFAKGDRVDVIGTSIGTGFTGVMKRFNFHGKDATHGTSKYFRHGGSNGSNTFPGRVLKNKGMPGHNGAAKSTVINIEVVDVKPEENLILLRGAIPGHDNGTVLIRTSKRAKAKPEGRSLVAAQA
jgi:large subunit ribosomal protein L3